MNVAGGVFGYEDKEKRGKNKVTDGESVVDWCCVKPVDAVSFLRKYK